MKTSHKTVKPKKELGQHFLEDDGIAADIVALLQPKQDCNNVLEIGPGMGILSKKLLERPFKTWLLDIDKESITYLKKHFSANKESIIEADFLKFDIGAFFNNKKVAIIGNFPYNIGSQILFRVLDCKNQIPEVVCMLQKEVAERLAEGPGSKSYGILSVLLQAWYTITYHYTVPEYVFNPPPKVKSGVIRLVRNDVTALDCNEKLFVTVVKQGFNNRRKTLRNALKPLGLPAEATTETVFNQRAEQLSVADFVALTNIVDNYRKSTTTLPQV